MRNLTASEINHVAGAAPITGAELNDFCLSVYNGAVIGATTYAFLGGKWGGLAAVLTFGVSQLIGVGLGIIIGGIDGAIYGATHSAEESEAYFMNIAKSSG